MGFLRDLQFIKIKWINSKKQQGFTLIETIAVIMLVGIISAVLGLAIVQGVKSYVFAKTNVSVSQKAQLAIARMERELQAITEIDPNTPGDECIRYKRETDLNASLYYRAIGLNGNQLEMNAPTDQDASCPVDGNILMDNVSSFSVSYDPDGLDELENIHLIRIDFTVNRVDSDRTETFNIAINPRNNGMLNAPGSAE